MQFQFGSAITRKPWFVYHYDRRVMEEVKRLTPSVSFKPFDKYLTRYVRVDSAAAYGRRVA